MAAGVGHAELEMLRSGAGCRERLGRKNNPRGGLGTSLQLFYTMASSWSCLYQWTLSAAVSPCV